MKLPFSSVYLKDGCNRRKDMRRDRRTKKYRDGNRHADGQRRTETVTDGQRNSES